MISDFYQFYFSLKETSKQNKYHFESQWVPYSTFTRRPYNEYHNPQFTYATILERYNKIPTPFIATILQFIFITYHRPHFHHFTYTTTHPFSILDVLTQKKTKSRNDLHVLPTRFTNFMALSHWRNFLIYYKFWIGLLSNLSIAF